MRNLLRSLAFLAIASASFGIGATSASAVTWNLPAADLTSEVRPTKYPQIAIAPDGATTVVWQSFTGTRYIIQAATRPAGSSVFGSPQNLSTGPDPDNPRVAVAPDGATTVVWENNDGGSQIILAATRPAGSNVFGLPQDLSEDGGNAFEPEVAVAPDGATTVVWRRFNGLNMIAQAATRPAGSSVFGSPQDLSVGLRNAYEPQVAISPVGGATTVVWRSYNGADETIRAATRPAGSDTFGAPQELSATEGNAYEPQVAIAPDGATTVVWIRDSLDSDFIVQAKTRPANSETFGATQSLSEGVQDAVQAQVAVAPNGATTVVWQTNDGINSVIQAATRAAGSSSFGTPRDLSATGGDAGSPQIAIAPDGATAVVWYRSEGSNDVVQASSRAAGATAWSAPVALSESREVNRDPLPAIAAANDGAFTATWELGGIVQAVTSEKTPTVRVRSAKAKVLKRSVLITSRVKVSGRGRISQRATTGKGKKARTWCNASKKAGAARTYTVKCKIGNKGRKALRNRALKLTLRTTFTPAGAKALTKNRKLTIKRKR
jgi:hypothetical protein